jgi:hypothetical protein
VVGFAAGVPLLMATVQLLHVKNRLELSEVGERHCADGCGLRIRARKADSTHQ